MNIENKHSASENNSLIAEAQQLWLEGEWQKLIDLEPKISSVKTIRLKAELACLLASAYLQNGDLTNGRDWLDNAQEWGAEKGELIQMLACGVNNSLGSIAALQQRNDQMRQNFAAAVSFLSSYDDQDKVILRRTLRQLKQLGLLQQASWLIEDQVKGEEGKDESLTKAQVKMLKTEIDLLSHELSIAQKRFQLYNSSAGQTGNLPYLEKMRRKSTSQLGQDLWVLEKTNFKRNGFFVEFGATDGILLSNSYLLEKEFGWQGICAEPNPKFFQKLKNNRSCTVSNECIGARTGEKIKFVFAQEFGGMEKHMSSDMHVDKRQAYLDAGETKELVTISLHDFLVEHNAPKNIDYISIDTEGSELDILASFPFDRWNVKILTIEHNYTSLREKINEVLSENGYCKYEAQWDDWYIKKEILK